MTAKTNPYIEKSAERLWYLSADKNERRAYDLWLREQLNYNTEMRGAEDRGREAERLQMAKEMLQDGKELAEIMKYTKLTEEKIAVIRKGIMVR